ncbi:MAG: hypothetical protein HY433_00675 [Candidatus Liptonbacteria bacterium]|nr:hypothetical protein [Candidatus Liptonbacteria bacterium]
MKKLCLSGGFLLISIFSLGSVSAAGITVTLPGITSAETANPGGWVSALYRFSLMAAGMLAFGMIVYAGLRYTFAAGNPSTQSDARDQILQALLGLLLLFGAFIVLTTINPNLTNLALPGLGKIEGQEATGEEQGMGPGSTSVSPNGENTRCVTVNGEEVCQNL